VLVDRGGAVTHVMVGDARSIELPDWGRMRAGRGRLRGLRCIHTHVGDEPLTRDDLTDLALLRLDAMVAVTTTAEGLPGLAHAAALRPANADGAAVEHLPPVPPGQLDLDFRVFIRDREEELARQSRTREVGASERAILVSVTAGRRPYDIEMQLDELKELAEKAQIPVITTLLGLGGFPGTHPLNLGMPGMHGMYWNNIAIGEADLVIGLGMLLENWLPRKCRNVQVADQ